ncbi:unnamed protein product [Discula destructiva]
MVSGSTDSSSSDDTSTTSSKSDDAKTSFYKSAHWTNDGTTIITSSWDNEICSFPIPEDLLEPRDQPLTLQSYRKLQLATPTNVVASAPYYDIRYANTDHLLVASQDHPLQLFQTGPQSQTTRGPQFEDDSRRDAPIASYHFTSPTTEAYYPVHSIVWSSPGTHFYVGTRDLIAQFDVTRNGEGPSALIPTIPSRRHIRKGNGVGMRGTVSALSAQTTADDTPTGLVAAGTWTRWVGLYDMARSAECTATWSIADAVEAVVHTDPPAGPSRQSSPASSTWTSASGISHPVTGIGGAGIMQTAWSPCGRYLLLNERQSTGILVYDVRGTNKVLGFLAGRDARTHQRMGCDVFSGLDSVGGFEVWAGAVDGTVKVWEGVGNSEGCQWPSWDFSAADGADGDHGSVSPALGSVGLHPSGSVVATCAGAWSDGPPRMSTRSASDETDGITLLYGKPGMSRIEESSLKLWRIGASEGSNYAEATAEPEQGDLAMEEADDIEQHRQRVLLALRTAESDDPEPIDQFAVVSDGLDDSKEEEAAEHEATETSTLKTQIGHESQDAKHREATHVHHAESMDKSEENVEQVNEPEAMASSPQEK